MKPKDFLIYNYKIARQLKEIELEAFRDVAGFFPSPEQKDIQKKLELEIKKINELYNKELAKS